MLKKSKKITFMLVLLLLSVVAVLGVHNVSKTITEEDVLYIHKIVQETGYDWDSIKLHDGFEEEVEDIRAVQAAVLGITPTQKQVPNRQTRNPKDIYELRYAQCSDRSYVMDKMLRLAGFQVRIASVYGTAKTGSALKSLLSTNKDLVRSHSMVEVLTSRGWMMVDTNDLWIGLDKEGQPVDLEAWHIKVRDGNPDIWSDSNSGEIYWLMEDAFTFVYGLYSRHGYFYPPYNAFPDVNWVEFRYNLFKN